ncbi:MAG: hypothetical protein AVDCRST_MAG59-2259, partial [uncultured Thermomicrobiales bacterium]
GAARPVRRRGRVPSKRDVFHGRRFSPTGSWGEATARGSHDDQPRRV